MTRDSFNRQAGHWDKTSTEQAPAKLAALAKRLKLTNGEIVLDIGTGTGVFLPFVFKEIGAKGRIISLDFADKMLQRARGNNSGKVEFICGDACEMPLESSFCNTAVCYQSFAHFHDKSKALNEIKRVLVPGGRLFICHTSSRNDINAVHHKIPEAHHDMIPDSAEMKDLLRQAGFVDVFVEDKASYFASAVKPT